VCREGHCRIAAVLLYNTGCYILGQSPGIYLAPSRAPPLSALSSYSCFCTSGTMLLVNTLSAVLAVASSAVARNIPRAATTSVYEKLNGPPTGWAVDDSTPINKDTSMMKLRVQLVPQNVDKFHELAMNVRRSSCLRPRLLIYPRTDRHSRTCTLRKPPHPEGH
jgi:hypothetical protein